MPPKRKSASTSLSSNKKRPQKPSSTPSSIASSTTPPQPPDTSIYFWRPQESPYGVFSQWYLSPLTAPLQTFPIHAGKHTSASVNPITFNTAEQYMMAHKAHLFAPGETSYLTEILATTDPKMQRALGRTIPNFTDEVWHAHRYGIVVEGSYLKFTQDGESKGILLGTGERELVEASPRDRIWGVGFGAKNAGGRRKDWGLNLLGKALMEVRERIRTEEKEGKRVNEKAKAEEKPEDEKERADTATGG